MAGNTYVTRGYSNYTNAPPQEFGYSYGPNQQGNWYMVETTRVERVHVPSSGYTNFGGAPSRNELFKDYVSYTPRDHYEGYEVNYGLEYENSSPPHYVERENLMDKFLNKLQLEASRPTNFGYISSANKFPPTSPNKYRPKSPTHNDPPKEPYFIRAQNLSGPNKYRPSSPNKYRPSSPTKYRPSSPTKYRPISPTKYRPISPTKYRPSSPTKYRPISPTKYHPSSPTKYHPSRPTNYRPISPTKYRPSSPPKYHPSSPTKYHPSSPTKYRPTIPTHNYPSKGDYPNKSQNHLGPNKYRPTSPVRTFPSNGQPIGTQTLSGPNKLHIGPGSEGSGSLKVGDFLGPNNNGQSTGPPATRLLTTPTNDINETLNILDESANNSPRADPESTRVFNKLTPRDSKPTFGGVARRLFGSNTIDSQQAARRYNGAQVP